MKIRKQQESSFAEVCRGLQRFAEVCRGLQRFAEVCRVDLLVVIFIGFSKEVNMWCLETLEQINILRSRLASQGLPESTALFLVVNDKSDKSEVAPSPKEEERPVLKLVCG